MNALDTGRLAGLNINDNGFAFDSRSDESFSVNHTGQRVIRHLVAGCDLEQIPCELAGGLPGGRFDDPPGSP